MSDSAFPPASARPGSPPAITIVIEPTTGFRALKLADLWAYRDLLMLMVWRDFASRYKQTVLGPLWFIVQPLMTTLVFTLVFGRFAQIPTAGVPATLFYLAGLLGWNYFANTFTSTSNTLVTNAAMFGKVYFPRLVVPLSAVISNIVSLLIQLFTFAVVFVIIKLGPDADRFGVQASALWLPLIVLHVGALSLGTGLWVAALTTKFRDFTVLSGFAVQLWMYGTPVIYAFDQVPERWRWLVALNPMTMPTEATRAALLGAGAPTAGLYLVSLAVTAAVLISGLFLFQRVEKTFVDVA